MKVYNRYRIRSKVNMSNSHSHKPLTLICTSRTLNYHHPRTPTCTVNISYCNPHQPLIFTSKVYSMQYTSQFSLSNSHHPQTNPKHSTFDSNCHIPLYVISIPHRPNEHTDCPLYQFLIITLPCPLNIPLLLHCTGNIV